MDQYKEARESVSEAEVMEAAASVIVAAMQKDKLQKDWGKRSQEIQVFSLNQQETPRLRDGNKYLVDLTKIWDSIPSDRTNEPASYIFEAKNYSPLIEKIVALLFNGNQLRSVINDYFEDESTKSFIRNQVTKKWEIFRTNVVNPISGRLEIPKNSEDPGGLQTIIKAAAATIITENNTGNVKKGNGEDGRIFALTDDLELQTGGFTNNKDRALATIDDVTDSERINKASQKTQDLEAQITTINQRLQQLIEVLNSLDHELTDNDTTRIAAILQPIMNSSFNSLETLTQIQALLDTNTLERKE